jgi:hypothetical protein
MELQLRAFAVAMPARHYALQLVLSRFDAGKLMPVCK